MTQGVLKTFKINFKWVSKWCQGSFKEVSRVFPEYIKIVSRKFQENVNSGLKKFHVVWHSLQLPEQKEGLFVQSKAYEIFNVVLK